MISVGFAPPVVDPAQVRDFVRSPASGVATDLMRRGTNVQGRARQYVRKRTRKLERSIVKRLTVDHRGPVVWIGSDVDYARLEHDGTRSHVIRPRRRKVLRFPKNGRLVFTTIVRHPGTQGSYFLLRALPAARD